jgi:DNA-binding transcriptional LysR family regulator
MHPDRVVEAVRDGSADLGVISFPRKWTDLVVVPWRDEEMVVVLPPGHKLAEHGPIQVGSLDGQACVHFDADLVVRREIDRSLRRRGVHLESVLTFDNIENIKRAVEVGAGLAILPRAAVGREEELGTLVARPLADHPLCRPLAIVHRNDPAPSPAARAFLAELMSDLDGSAGPGTAAKPAAEGASTPAAGRN